MACARAGGAGRDCDGDSGGFVGHVDGEGRAVVDGVVSFGLEGRCQKVGLQMVMPHLSWILGKIAAK